MTYWDEDGFDADFPMREYTQEMYLDEPEVLKSFHEWLAKESELDNFEDCILRNGRMQRDEVRLKRLREAVSTAREALLCQIKKAGEKKNHR